MPLAQFVRRQASSLSATPSNPNLLRRRQTDRVYSPHRQRFFSTQMIVRLSRPAICSSRACGFRRSSSRTLQPTSAPAAQLMRTRRRDSFSPFALSLFCLAITVGLWACSYRISRYSVHTSRVFVAKLWVENRLAIAAERATAHNSAKQLGAGASAAAAANILPVQGRAAARSAQPRLRLLLCLAFPTPLRSPPVLLSL